MAASNLPNRIIDGDSQFRRGFNSVNPLDLPAGFYYRSTNMSNRGGVLQTRPGYKWMATLPSGNLQGLTIFTPKDSSPQMVVAVDGAIYRSFLPYKEFEQLEGIEFSATAKDVFFATGTKSVRRNADASLTFIAPVNTLMMQDGVNAPAYYDGNSFGHLTGSKTTPIGTVMAWSGDRLWVASGNHIFVSDIDDPYSFFEDTYNTLGGRQFFLVEKEVTGMIEVPGAESPQLLAYTDSECIAFQSNIRNRDLWTTTADFQRTLFDIGCVSHRSLVAQNGLLHWFSPFGLVSLDSAVLAKHSSQINLLDNELAWSKSNLNAELSGVAAGSFENYLMVSVPYSDHYNRHTWVLDFTVKSTLNEQQPPAWASVWTGTRPVAWATSSIQGVPRIFFISRDYDNSNRLWEAFDSSRRDEGCDIDFTWETRVYSNGDITNKKFRFSEFGLANIQGAVDLRVWWAGGTKGRWRETGNVRIYANEGNIDGQLDLPDVIFGLKSQVRIFRTQDIKEKDNTELQTCGVESERNDTEDMGFMLRIAGSGPCAFMSARVFMDQVVEKKDGKCFESETEGHYVRIDGAASATLEPLEEDVPEEFLGFYFAESTYQGVTVNGFGSANSSISQEAADKLAFQRAWAIVNAKLLAEAPPFVGGGENEEAFDGGLDFSIEDNSQYLPMF